MRTLLFVAIKASIKAGEEIMKVYTKNDFDVVMKSDDSPLTEADEKANTAINFFLKTTKYPIISEENKKESYHIRKNWNTCWMVDPLDGTKEFIKKNGEFTVNIALIKDAKPVLGVIYIPESKTLYYTITSENKAYKTVLKDHKFTENMFKDNIEIMRDKIIDDEIKVVGSRSHKSKETEMFVQSLKQKFKDVSFVSSGSSLKFCLVAEGKANIYPRFAPTMEWDTAAGHAICNALGLKVMQVDQDEELCYNKKDLLNPYFIVQ